MFTWRGRFSWAESGAHSLCYCSSQVVSNVLCSWLCHAVTVKTGSTTAECIKGGDLSHVGSPCLIILKCRKYEYFMILQQHLCSSSSLYFITGSCCTLPVFVPYVNLKDSWFYRKLAIYSAWHKDTRNNLLVVLYSSAFMELVHK
jgi:hypothetical protein